MSLDIFTRDQRELATLARQNFVPGLAPSFAQTFDAAVDESRLFANSTAEANSRAAFMQQWLDRFQAETGEVLLNPFALGDEQATLAQARQADPLAQYDPATGTAPLVRPEDLYLSKLRQRFEEYRKANPNTALHFPTDEEIAAGAVATARTARANRAALDRLPQTWTSRAGSVLGDVWGTATDPINVMSMAAGASAASGILRTALVEGGIGMSSQAAIEVATDDFKRQVDPTYGLDDAAANVVFAGMGGAAIGGGLKALEQGARAVLARRRATRLERDALNVVEREASIDGGSPFPDAGVTGEVAHRQALSKATEALDSGRAPDVAALTSDAVRAQQEGAAARRKAFESDRLYETGRITAEERVAAWRGAGIEPEPMLLKPHEVVAFAESAKDVADRKVAAILGTVDDASAEGLKAATGLDLGGYRHEIDNFGIRHALEQHGNPAAEAKRGQIAITTEDFARVPAVLAAPDNIEPVGQSATGRDVLRYSKSFPDGSLYYVEEVRAGRQRLAFTTMYKRGPDPTNGGAAAPRATSYAPDGVAQTSETPAASGDNGRRAGSGQGLTRVYTPIGTPIEVRYRVVEADSLVTSNTPDGAVNPAYPADLQPRDRSRAGLVTQVAEMAGRLEPERLGRSPDAAAGAPIVGPDLVVESGNGRSAAIRLAYEQGGEAAARYRSWLEGQYPEAADMQRPVLVAERVTPLAPAERRAFAAEANQATAARMSPVEMARSDARLLDDAALGAMRGSDITAASNRPFVRAFLDKLPATERAELVDADGLLNQAGRRRVEGAVLARAYDDPKLLGRIVEDLDSDIKAIGGALLDSAGPWARMRAAAARGELADGMDITPDLLAAVRTVIEARAAGRAVKELALQEDMFGGGLSDVARLLLQTMFRDADLAKPAGRARMADALAAYADEAMKNVAGPRLFGDALSADDIARGVLPEELRPTRPPKPADLAPTSPKAPDAMMGAEPADLALFQDVNRLMRERDGLEVVVGEAIDPVSGRPVSVRRKAEDIMDERDRDILEANELAACAFGIAAE